MATKSTTSRRLARKNRIEAERRARRARAQVVPPGNPDTHQAHPEHPSDSSVAHAPASGSARAEGGYPSGEYDVTKPVATPAAAKQDTRATLIDAHFGDVDLQALTDLVGEDRRISDSELPLILEALPIGAILEHEGLNRWRVKGPASGGIRWGHGTTAVGAVESYVLGEGVQTETDAAAQRFAKLSSTQQAEIIERDKVAADTLAGVTNPTEAARKKALEQKAAGFKPSPIAVPEKVPETPKAKRPAARKRAKK